MNKIIEDSGEYLGISTKTGRLLRLTEETAEEAGNGEITARIPRKVLKPLTFIEKLKLLFF